MHQRAELLMHVVPFAQADEGEVVVLAEFAGLSTAKKVDVTSSFYLKPTAGYKLPGPVYLCNQTPEPSMTQLLSGITPQRSSNPSGWREYFFNPPIGYCKLLAGLAVVMGIAYRISQYLPDRSFWLDEALLLPNILNKNLLQLLGKLDNNQSSPPLFLWAERGMALAFGPSEHVMRFIPQLAGVASMVLFAILAWRVLAPAVVFWVVCWFAFSTDLIWHAVCIKQYSGDVLVSVLFLLLAIGRCDQGETASNNPTRRLMLVAAFGAIAVWFSQPAIFMFTGISLCFLPAFHRRGRRGWIAYLACNLIVVVPFVLLYFTAMRHQRVDGLVNFWADDMADYSRPWTIPWWIIRETYRLCELPYKALGPLVVILTAVGGYSLWRRNRRLLGFYALPVVMTILAGCLRVYPYHGGRVTIFLVPAVLLLSGEALMFLRERLSNNWRPWWWTAAVPFLIVGLFDTAMHQVRPMGRCHIRPVVQYIRQHRQPGDGLYLINEGSTPAAPILNDGGIEFLLYWPEPDPPFHRTLPDAQCISEQRFWIAFPFLPRHGTRFLDPTLNLIRRHAIEKDRFILKTGGAAYLFEQKTGGTANGKSD